MTRGERPQRTRRAPSRLDTGGDTAGVDLAIRKSLVEKRREDVKIPEAPVFRPTSAEFRDPFAFLASIRDAGERSGIVRIIPPPDWDHSFVNPMGADKTFETKRQHIHRLQEGLPFDDGLHYTYDDYRRQAVAFKSRWVATHPTPAGVTEEQHVEQCYWRLVECCQDEVTVEYANDLDTSCYGSGFTAQLSGARCNWDLNGLIHHPENVLRAVDSCVPGVTQPWLYYGTLFATFCWHKEDHNLYSVNYLHTGESKTWYGVPPSASKTFEKALRQSVPRLFEEDPDILHSLTTMLPPSACVANGVALVHTVQHPGELVVTFPAAFHAGFSHGFNCAEAVNIGDVDWLKHGRAAVESYRVGPGRRPATFSHEKLLWRLVQCCRRVHALGRSLQICLTRRCFTILHARGDNGAVVVVPERSHQCILQEACALAKEQLHLRDWLLRNGCRPALPMQCADGDDLDCYVCGTLPFLAAVRCACSPGRVTCLHHGFAMCDCKGHLKQLEVRVEDAELLRLSAVPMAPSEAAPMHARPSVELPDPAIAQGKRVRPHMASLRVEPSAPDRCCECGGHGLRVSLLRCVACDGCFHRKCGDIRTRSNGAELCLCPSCYSAQF